MERERKREKEKRKEVKRGERAPEIKVEVR